MLTAELPCPASPVARRLLSRMGREIEEIGRDIHHWVEPEPFAIPAWDRLSLESRFRPPVPILDLCLLEDSHPLGWTSVEMRLDGSIRWIELPTGPQWAREVLEEAVGEWILQMGARP